MRLFWGILFIFGAVHWWQHHPATPTPGISAPTPPKQTNTTRNSFVHKGYQITPLANYQITARILSTRRYFFDEGAKLIPIDLALGWGIISDPVAYKKINVTQDDRWYRYSYTSDLPTLISSQIALNSANTHIIPANQQIAKQVFALRENETVTLKGLLVEAAKPSSWHIRSSTTRTDTGAGACEVFWVESVEKK